MFHSKIDAAAPGLTSGPDESAIVTRIQSTLVTMTAGLDARFVRAGTTLTTMLESIHQMLRSLDGVARALGPEEASDAVGQLTRVATRLSNLPATSSRRDKELSGVRRFAGGLYDEVFAIRDILRVLRIFAVNIKIAASNDPVFVDLAQHIFDRLDSGEAEMAPLMESISRVQRDLKIAGKTEKMLAEEARRVIPAAPRQLMKDARDLETYQRSVADLAADVSGCARAVQGKVAAVLGALQIGDITRQRLEHVFAGLQLLQAEIAHGELDEARAGAVKARLYTLMVDQLTDTATEFRRGAEALLQSLSGIAADTSHLLDLSDGDRAGNAGTSMLGELERGVSSVAQLIGRLRAADDEMVMVGQTIVTSVDELAQRIGVVRALRTDVEQIAINVRLRCHRAGAAGRAVAVIAVEVRNFANLLDGIIVRVERHLDGLQSANGTMRELAGSADDADPNAILDASLRTIRNACRAVETHMGSAGSNSRQVVDMLDAMIADLRSEMEIGLTVSQLACELAALSPAMVDVEQPLDGPTATLFDKVAKLYTMAREREVHRAHVPGAAGTEAQAPEPAFDDDDDGLF